MTKPIIGLNLDVNVQKPSELRIARSYSQALEECGAVPVLIPPMKNTQLKPLLQALDGVVLIGGRDYSAHLYGEPESELTCPLHDDRQEFDLRLAKCALKMEDLPILGICGGLQLLNIALKGTLIQDIAAAYPDSDVVHRGKESSVRHGVSLVASSRLAKIYRSRHLDSIVSSHHQAIKKLGKGLIIAGTADDGIIEAAELLHREFVIGVQWHPERDISVNKRLFRALALAAGDRARSRSRKKRVR